MLCAPQIISKVGTIARAINRQCVVRRTGPPVMWPPSHLLYRGGGFNDSFRVRLGYTVIHSTFYLVCPLIVDITFEFLLLSLISISLQFTMIRILIVLRVLVDLLLLFLMI